MQERRSYARLDLDGDVQLESGNGRSRIFKACLDDFSFGGFRMYSPERIEVDKGVRFVLTTKLLEQPLGGTGRVRHVQPVQKYRSTLFEVGVEFARVNQHKVIRLIRRTLGWRERPGFYKRHRKEIGFLLGILPTAFVVMWLVLGTADKIRDSAIKDAEYEAAFRSALIHYLSK